MAVTQSGSRPSSRTFTTSGIGSQYGPPPSATVTSSPPAPIASIPRPPPVGVWESEPSSVSPGTANRSWWTWWQIPFPGRLNHEPYLCAAVWR